MHADAHVTIDPTKIAAIVFWPRPFYDHDENGRPGGPLAAGYPVPPSPLLCGVRVIWQSTAIAPIWSPQIGNAVTYAHY